MLLLEGDDAGSKNDDDVVVVAAAVEVDVATCCVVFVVDDRLAFVLTAVVDGDEVSTGSLCSCCSASFAVGCFLLC